jgi:hypothetical protein
MKRSLLIFIILLLILAAQFVSVTFAHLLIRANGEVRLKKEGDFKYHLTGPGERLGSEDILHPASGSKVYVFCDDINVRLVPAGKRSGINAICPNDETLDNLDDAYAMLRSEDSIPQAGGVDPQIPYAISPRLTYVDTPRPALRWNRVGGASSYTVRILKQRGRMLWQKKDVPAAGIPMPYPNDAPSLRWGVSYLVAVETDQGASSLYDPGACSGFQVLDEDEIQEIKTRVSQIAGLTKLTSVEKAVVEAYVYRQHHLISAAIEKLDSLVKLGTQSALVCHTLGELYAKVGLNLHAEDRYRKAQALYKAGNDAYGSAQIQKELTIVKKNLQQIQSAGKKRRGCSEITMPDD